MKLYETPGGVEEYAKMSEGYSLEAFSPLIYSHLPPSSSILEIGSGPGNDYAWLSRYHKVTGSDYSSCFVDYCKRKYPNGEFLSLDALHLDVNKSFDAIFSSKVYQHMNISDLKISLKKQYEILKPKGLIIHSFWIGGREEIYEDMKFYYHEATEIESLVNGSFEILEKKEYGEMEEGDSLFLIGRKR